MAALVRVFWFVTGFVALGLGSKIFSIVSMVAVFMLSLVLGVGPVVRGVQAAVLGGAAAFVLSRPLPQAG